jgi:hypothetical protein
VPNVVILDDEVSMAHPWCWQEQQGQRAPHHCTIWAWQGVLYDPESTAASDLLEQTCKQVVAKLSAQAAQDSAQVSLAARPALLLQPVLYVLLRLSYCCATRLLPPHQAVLG